MSVLLPSFSDPFHTFTTTLDGQDFGFEFRYNQREDRWYFSIADANGELIAAGIKVVCLRPLLRKCADIRAPAGTLWAIPNGNDDSPPGLNDLGEGKRVTISYYADGELA